MVRSEDSVSLAVAGTSCATFVPCAPAATDNPDNTAVANMVLALSIGDTIPVLFLRVLPVVFVIFAGSRGYSVEDKAGHVCPDP